MCNATFSVIWQAWLQSTDGIERGISLFFHFFVFCCAWSWTCKLHPRTVSGTIQPGCIFTEILPNEKLTYSLRLHGSYGQKQLPIDLKINRARWYISQVSILSFFRRASVECFHISAALRYALLPVNHLTPTDRNEKSSPGYSTWLNNFRYSYKLWTKIKCCFKVHFKFNSNSIAFHITCVMWKVLLEPTESYH